MDEDEIQNLCLIELEALLKSNGRSLREFHCLSYPIMMEDNLCGNHLIADELNYNTEELKHKLMKCLNH